MMTMRILIVDDEVDFATTLSERLEIRGYDLQIAHSGSEALTLIKEQTPDIVLLDINMPDMNGFETLEAILHIAPDVSVYMLTGHAYESHKDESFEKGAKDCLTKPIDLKLLIEKIT